MLVGSIGGFVSYIYALQHLPVATVSLYAYANPLIAVVARRAALLGEPFTTRTVIAMAIVFAGMTLVRARKPSPTPRRRRSCRPRSGREAPDVVLARLKPRPLNRSYDRVTLRG